MKDANEERLLRPTDPGPTSLDAFEDYRRAVARKATAPVRRPLVPAGGALLCAGLVAVGATGPWLRQRSSALREVETTSGLETDGILALIGAIVAIGALLVLLIRPRTEPAAWAALAGLGLSAVVGAANWLVFDTTAPGFEAQSRSATYEIGWGLVVVIVAGVLGTACAALVVRQID